MTITSTTITNEQGQGQNEDEARVTTRGTNNTNSSTTTIKKRHSNSNRNSNSHKSSNNNNTNPLPCWLKLEMWRAGAPDSTNARASAIFIPPPVPCIPPLPCPGTQLDEDTATELEYAVDDGPTKKIAESSQFKPKGCESQGGGGGGKGISICSANVEETG